MNIIDIVKNAPKGADRYVVFGEGSYIEYYAIINGVKSFYSSSKKRWMECGNGNFNSSLPLPELKTEWVKVEDSIFHPQLQVDFESGALYTLTTDGAYKELEADENHLMVNLVASNLYRKVEKVIYEKQEFIEKACMLTRTSAQEDIDIIGKMFDAGCRFIESD